jgi:formylglycine-generating enzyme required for sulfatase activity
LFHSAALAEKRLALLIGNEAYTSAIGRLANPHNDVALLEETLKGVGFEVVSLRDAGLGALNRAVNAYARRVQAAGAGAIGFFYYSGHGASDGNTNYLIPVDVQTTETGELWDQSLRLTEITRKLKSEAGNATHFVVFDACRNTLKLTQPGSRAMVQSKGFVPVSQENGMLIAYATAEGELASDLGSDAGPYAKVLAEEIVKSGIEAVAMFRVVQRRVRAAIRQEPYLGFSALGDVYFGGKSELPAAASPTPQRLSEAAEAWTIVKDTTNIAALEAFMARFKSTYYADLAALRVEELKKGLPSAPSPKPGPAEQVAIGAPPPQPASPKLKEPVAATQPERCDGIEARVGSEKRCLKPGDTFRDCPECPEMVVVPAGRFTMGSPASEPEREPAVKGSEDQYSVTISKQFAVGRFAVTRGDFAAFVTATGHNVDGGCYVYTGPSINPMADRNWRSPGFTQNDSHPVVCVNWDDAKTYVAWLSKRTGKTYRLPSEAEREYVTRAGTTTAYWWGSSIAPSQANYDPGLYNRGLRATVPVDTFKANPWGFYNVHGNVREWTEDCWNDANAGNAGEGSARTSGQCNRRVVRGGSWMDTSHFLRSAYRFGASADYRSHSYGFRLARTLNP